MFTIYAGDKLLWSEIATEPRYALVDPIVKNEINKSGSLEFTMLEGHILYDEMTPFGSDLIVYEDDEVFFEGRVVDTSTSFYNERKVVAEGVMGYLNDTYVAPQKATETPEEHFRKLIEEHNNQCEDKKRFEVGIVTVTDSLGKVEFKSDSYRNTKSAIDSDLVSAYKAYIRVRRVGDKHYIDLLKDLEGDGTQEVRFALNLLDLTDENDAQDVFSVIVPVGKNQLTVEKVNNDSKEIKIESLYEKYGRIIKIVQFSEVDKADELLSKANEWIEQNVTNKQMREFNVTALDLSRLGYNVESFIVGKKYRIVSDPNRIDEVAYLKSMELHLAEMDETTLDFGDPEAGSESRGGVTSAAATITHTITTANDYLRERAEVTDRNLRLMGAELNIDFDKVNVNGGEVTFDGVSYINAIFGGLGIDPEDAGGVEGQFTKLGAKINANSERLETFYEKLRKTTLDPAITGWDGLIEYFTSRVSQTAEGLETEVKKTETYINGNNKVVDEFRSFMKQTPTDWSVYITKNDDISSMIELSGDGVTIQGGKITLDGQVIADSLQSLSINVGSIAVDFEVWGSDIYADMVVVDGHNIAFHTHTIQVSDEGDITLGEMSYGDSGGNFNIADTQFFKDAMSAEVRDATIRCTNIGPNQFYVTVSGPNGGYTSHIFTINVGQ